MVQASDPWGHPWAKRQMVQCSVLRPMGKPIGKPTRHWPGVPNTRTRTHGETHIEEAALRAASTKGGWPPSAAAPLCGFLYMGLSMGTGSCLWDARPAMCRVAYGFLPGYEHRALSHVTPCVRFSMGVPLGMSPKPSNYHLVLYQN